MNQNIKAGLVTIRNMMRDTQEAVDDFVDRCQHQDSTDDDALNKKLARALAYYYTPTDQEYLHFDEHCEAISAAGGCPPDPESYWSELAFNHWQYGQNE